MKAKKTMLAGMLTLVAVLAAFVVALPLGAEVVNAGCGRTIVDCDFSGCCLYAGAEYDCIKYYWDPCAGITRVISVWQECRPYSCI